MNRLRFFLRYVSVPNSVVVQSGLHPWVAFIDLKTKIIQNK